MKAFLILLAVLLSAQAAHAATFTVTNTNNAGAGSLRNAINSANSAAGADTIAFNIGSGAKTIAPTSALPEITGPVTINGNSQPGFAGTPLIELNGANAGAGASGLSIKAANCTVRGLVINRFSGDGIRISGGGSAASGNTVQGCFLGTDATGTLDRGNGGRGVIAEGDNTTIGGTTAAARNVISGNGKSGVFIFRGLNNKVQGNFVGTDKTGTAAIANFEQGVLIQTLFCTVGGTVAGARNVISGNNFSGVEIAGVSNQDNQVLGNFIGTAVNGTARLANAVHGVFINDAFANTIGGTVAGARNVISGNGGHGILIVSTAVGSLVQGNFIGLAKNGTALGNRHAGVVVSAPGTTIGGTSAAARNVISANTDEGVLIQGAGAVSNEVLGNFIGTAVNGIAPLGNGRGVTVQSRDNRIGGLTAGARNVISGNAFDGVRLEGADATGNLVQGNFIGLDKNGTATVVGGGNGVSITGGGANTIGGTQTGARNVIVGGSSGVFIVSGTGNKVQGNFIGTDLNGTAALGGNRGVLIQGANNVIGGTVPEARNVIAGSVGHGVHLQNSTATGNQVQGNFIGLDKNGTATLSNGGHGVFVENAVNNTIGGAASGAGNVISGNTLDGVRLAGGGTATTTLVQGNFIGTDATGALDRGNVGNGIFINRAFNNTVGGTVGGARNVISGNNGDGVLIFSATGNVLQSNRIGTKANGTDARGNTGHGVRLNGLSSGNVIGGTVKNVANTIAFNGGDGVFVELAATIAILGNSIHDNSGLGIDLDPNGVTANDSGDGDAGSNGRQNFPILTEALSSGPTMSIKGSLNSKPNATYRLEFFRNATCDPSGNGEGTSFLGTTNVTTSASGTVAFNVSVSAAPNDEFVTATATDFGGSTSEFSPCVPVNAADLLLVLTDTPDPVTAGEVLTYNLLVSNSGPASAIPTVTDPLPAGVDFVAASSTRGSCSAPVPGSAGGTVTCNLGTMNDGDSADITIKVRPPVSATITNTATINSSQSDPNLANNSDTETTTVQPRVDLQLSGTDASDPVTVGTELTYTLTITNLGRRDATGMTLTDDLPAGVDFLSATPAPASQVGRRLTFNFGPLVVGASRSVTIRARPTAVGTLTNMARVELAPGHGDPDLSNNSVSINTEVISCARDVTSQVRVTRGTVQPAGSYSECFYGHCRWQQTVTLENHGATPIVGPLALVLDNLDSGVALTNANGATECSGLSGSPFVTTPSGLNPGATVDVTLEFEAARAADIRYQTRVLAGPGER